MAFDLDDELEATRKMYGLDKEKNIEKSIKNLKKYIKEDEFYTRYKNNEYNEISDFEMFCINYCKDIENLLEDYKRQKQRNEEHQKINGELREKVKELEAKLEFKQYGDLDNLKFEEYMNEFIPNQKIKDKIEELKDLAKRIAGTYQYADSYEHLQEKKDKVIELRTKAEALEELLQEENT